MTDKQPEVLRLADELDCRGMNRPSWKDQFDAGYELRRLHKENEVLRARLAQPEHVSYAGNGTAGREDMTAPTGFFFQMPKPEREWVGLTDEEITALKRNGERYISSQDFARAIEAKLKEKNA